MDGAEGNAADAEGGAVTTPGGADLVEVYNASGVDADVIHSLLEGHGIPAVVNHAGSGAYPVNVGAMGAGQVLVRREDAEAARELIDAAVRGDLQLPDED